MRILVHISAKFTFIENEGFNCLARHGYNLKRNFGHGSKGLANLLATLNLFAFTLHSVLDCIGDLWRQCRDRAGTRRDFFEELRFLTKWCCFPSWTALFDTMLGKRPPPGLTPPPAAGPPQLPCQAASDGLPAPTRGAAARRPLSRSTSNHSATPPRTIHNRHLKNCGPETWSLGPVPKLKKP